MFTHSFHPERGIAYCWKTLEHGSMDIRSCSICTRSAFGLAQKGKRGKRRGRGKGGESLPQSDRYRSCVV
ncbi:hypothetical protein AV530_011861 [Patagioenas fasciata monilis]|uniref:Uncharacterized protein n=1 Tax=Patagioenas fasciata monilis TaxID=372326 RepID=A0A1V4JUD5_PATFA|nr:hypothetical protein AV530_011861 [Patagioenas fasciata monilis]